ncbi:MAG: inositol phosphatase [Deltaproteobacteria bacterium]|nr:inositol phosphatase [Deltaproteobacteria bacterium]
MSTFLDTAKAAVALAVKTSLKYYKGDIRVETKPDRSPVTQADKESELAIIALLTERYPSHAILGEEGGAHEKQSEHRWIIDPVDGTRGFARGGTFWGPLVALEHKGEVVVGAMAMPALGEMYYAEKGGGTWHVSIDKAGRALSEAKRMHVSSIAAWEDATLSLGELQRLLGGPKKDVVAALASTAANARCFGDLAACAMLFCGRAEAWIEGGVQIWDLAALKILVEEAGGRFTDLDGKPTHTSGHALATNGKFHDVILAQLKRTQT